jgi:hypothetical protein
MQKGNHFNMMQRNYGLVLEGDATDKKIIKA